MRPALLAPLRSLVERWIAIQRAEPARAIGTLGHELRNTVASALMAYRLLESSNPGLDRDAGRLLEHSLLHIRALAEQSLALARLGHGVAPVTEPLRLRPLVDEIVAGARNERHLEVRIAISEDLELHADRHLFESALTNLIHNALKFTRLGGTVEVRAARAASGVTVDVTDECGGLLEEAQDTLFEPFVQGRHRKGGVGLGLSIARDAIAAHHGRLEVLDMPGRGCVFRAWLPCRLAP